MASQRLTVVTIAGVSSRIVAELFRSWQHPTAGSSAAAEIDAFCIQLRAMAASLPIVHFNEWIERWLMGDKVPGPGSVAGTRFQACCLTPIQAKEWARSRGRQFVEEKWLATQLKQAADAWQPLVQESVVVLMREPFGGSTLDEEVIASLATIPEWLAQYENRTAE